MRSLFFFAIHLKNDQASTIKSPSKAAPKQPAIDNDEEPVRKKIALDLSSSFVPFNKEPIDHSSILKIDGKLLLEFNLF